MDCHWRGDADTLLGSLGACSKSYRDSCGVAMGVDRRDYVALRMVPISRSGSRVAERCHVVRLSSGAARNSLPDERTFETLPSDAQTGLTPRWNQRRLPLPPSLGSYGGTSEFMDGLSYTTVIEPADPLARRRGSALDR